VGITNSGSTFPVVFSYCFSKSKESLVFFFKCLKRELFKDNTPPCRVVIDNQASGLITAIPEALPETILQSCDWHAVEAMKRRFRQSEYKKDQVDTLSDLY
jgi:MULE transposase domain